jgi:hypothetical protein
MHDSWVYKDGGPVMCVLMYLTDLSQCVSGHGPEHGVSIRVNRMRSSGKYSSGFM